MTARSGIEFQRPFRAMDLAFVELAAGRLTVAAELVDDGLESALDSGNAPMAMWLRYPDGLVHAHLGDDERARRAAAEMRAWGSEHGEHPRMLMAHHVAGVLALAQRRRDGGARRAPRRRRARTRSCGLRPSRRGARAPRRDRGGGRGRRRPISPPTWPPSSTAQAAALRLPWVDAAACRGRGLAPTAAGDKAARIGSPRRAAAFDALGYRLDAARAWWWHGRALQRDRSPPARRPTCSPRPATASPSMGATPWAEQAAAELERVAPGRATGALTEDEARIAALVAEGRRNREIAADLYVSVATVEAHLTRIYRKLGVRSRTELSRRMLESSP